MSLKDYFWFLVDDGWMLPLFNKKGRLDIRFENCRTILLNRFLNGQLNGLSNGLLNDFGPWRQLANFKTFHIDDALAILLHPFKHLLAAKS